MENLYEYNKKHLYPLGEKYFGKTPKHTIKNK